MSRTFRKALERMPLFPLGTVIFPGAVLPLHVFEPRYRQLVRDILDGPRAFAIPLIRDPADVDEHGHPALHEICGVCEIRKFRELPDGRFHLLVEGVARTKIEELAFAPPYRIGRATEITSEDVRVDATDIAALVSVATRFVDRIRAAAPEFELPLPPSPSPAVLSDLCAHYLVVDPQRRQELLETLNVRARVRRATELIVDQGATLDANGAGLN